MPALLLLLKGVKRASVRENCFPRVASPRKRHFSCAYGCFPRFTFPCFYPEQKQGSNRFGTVSKPHAGLSCAVRGAESTCRSSHNEINARNQHQSNGYYEATGEYNTREAAQFVQNRLDRP